MANNNWDITKPIDHLKIGDVPAAIRDVTSSSKLVIAKEHETPGTDNAGGQHLRGSARVYLSDAVAVVDPEGNGLDTTSTTDDGRVHVNTSASNELRVYVATAAGISTGWEHIRVGRVKASTEIDANSRGVVNVASGTQTGQVIHVGQIDTTALTGQLQILTPATSAMLGVKVIDPPTADNHLVGKKFADAWHFKGLDGTEVFASGAAPTTFTDLDLSGTIGAIQAMCFLSITPTSTHEYSFRKNGSSKTTYFATLTGGVQYQVWCETDSGGILEWDSNSSDNAAINIFGYIQSE